jgi:hypothetical protein
MSDSDNRQPAYMRCSGTYRHTAHSLQSCLVPLLTLCDINSEKCFLLKYRMYLSDKASKFLILTIGLFVIVYLRTFQIVIHSSLFELQLLLPHTLEVSSSGTTFVHNIMKIGHLKQTETHMHTSMYTTHLQHVDVKNLPSA